MSSRPKVFCIGFQKTGTTSLHAALTQLGYKTAAVIGRDLTAEELAATGAALCIETARDYDAVQDMPWPIFFRELDAAFPGSKFILTVREPESWFKSIEGHFGAKPDEMQAFIYGRATPSPQGAAAHYLEIYRAHQETVHGHFANRPGDLLTLDLAAGDGWSALCGFLREPVPDAPFPVKNRSSDRKSLMFKIKRRVMMLAGKHLRPEGI